MAGGTEAVSNVWWPRTPHTKQIAAVLADGKPHSYDEIYTKVAPLILDGVAWRKAERQRTRAIELRVAKGERVMDADGRRMKGTDETAIRSGKRSMIGDGLDSALDRGRIRMWEDDKGQRWYQLNPEVRIGFLEKKPKPPVRTPEPEHPTLDDPPPPSHPEPTRPVPLSDEIRSRIEELREPKAPPRTEDEKEGETLEWWKARARASERQIRQLRRLATKMLAVIDELEDNDE